MEETRYLHLVEAPVPKEQGNKYIFFGPDGLKEAIIKALVLNAKVTRIRVFPDGSVKEMVIYSGSAATASTAASSLTASASSEA
jgi:hypothetical protein